ncbi:mannosyltransferase [Ecytonucleospora hepatopenaei]|uniref:Dolichol-phosphate mannosyltransferase subunit 1 n=1 Tax=Ecytonucleospora hepatopenaei TaxID=646526 RepID=A0A1W0E6A7_9MICR|nr:mannosyltransferase [Ecytonucleospora hepatopenaei]
MFNVILPTYNEAANILCMINILTLIFSKMKEPFLIIVVDDNSPDGTANIVKNKQFENVKVIERNGKLGLGSAYKEGIKHCVFDHTIILDVDLQQNPFDIIGMAKYCKKYDIVSSTRYAKRTKYAGNENEVVSLTSNLNKEMQVHGKVCNWPFKRKLISASANIFAQTLLGIKTSDLTCSFRIYRTEVLKKLLDQTIANGFGVQVELITRAEYANYKIKEYPITFYNRMYGESKLAFKEFYQYIMNIIYLYFKI